MLNAIYLLIGPAILFVAAAAYLWLDHVTREWETAEYQDPLNSYLEQGKRVSRYTPEL